MLRRFGEMVGCIVGLPIGCLMFGLALGLFLWPLSWFDGWQWLALAFRYLVMAWAISFSFQKARSYTRQTEAGLGPAIFFGTLLVAYVCYLIFDFGTPSDPCDQDKVGGFVRSRNVLSIGTSLVVAVILGALIGARDRKKMPQRALEQSE